MLRRFARQPQLESGKPVWVSRSLTAIVAGLGLFILVSCSERGAISAKSDGGVTYYNERFGSGPWSTHVVKIDRRDATLRLHSVMGRGTSIGLRPLSEQASSIPVTWGKPVAAVNGDFYAREGSAYSGDPRGLQIIDGELVSGPGEQSAFWIDANGEPHATNVISHFQITWPNGTSFPFGLNEEMGRGQMVLCTPAAGKSIGHRGVGLELVLEKAGEGPWLPLQIGENYQAKVRSIQQGGRTAIARDTLVLSVGSALVSNVPATTVGAVLTFTTETSPGLKGVRVAIGGGSIITHDGKVARLNKPSASRNISSYAVSSMFERHPRSAVGWNDTHFFLSEVDGRQRNLSVGMTLQELGDYMREIGCETAMSLDGGGSATLWFDGRVMNSPCDGMERSVANGLVVARNPGDRVAASASK
jgi:hypothetical protein